MIINQLPPAITSGGNFVRAMLNCCFPATAAWTLGGNGLSYLYEDFFINITMHISGEIVSKLSPVIDMCHIQASLKIV